MATPEQQRWQGRNTASTTTDVRERDLDDISPVWPGRPIRPMPRNRLRSQLSPEQADSIVYPPQPPPSSPLFSFPYGLATDRHGSPAATARTNGQPAPQQGRASRSSPSAGRQHHHHCDCGGYHPDHSDEEDADFDHPTYRWSPGEKGVGARHGPAPGKKQMPPGGRMTVGAGGISAHSHPPPPASIASSADGYESFENTSNKKKRKIPVSSGSGGGVAATGQKSLSAEMAAMGISGPVVGEYGALGDGGIGAAAMGLSGPGRGRYGRSKGVGKIGGPNGYTSSLSARSRGGDFFGDGSKPGWLNQDMKLGEDMLADGGRAGEEADQGIISSAIANAGALPTTPHAGKENQSLLSQQGGKDVKDTTPKSQFTFTCETDTSSKIVWPLQGSDQYVTPSKKGYYPVRSPTVDHSAQPVPLPRGSSDPRAMNANGRPPLPAQAAVPPQQLPPLPMNGQALPPPTRPPRRRRPSREFALAARQRRLQQEFTNYSTRPHKDNMWICEFCEYEDLWGHPPMALMRQYEIKDKAERAKAEERRRLLEKAKMKKNKGKGKGKGGKGGAAGTQQPVGGQGGAQQTNVPPPPTQQQHGHDLAAPYDPALDGQEEYYDDEEDGYDEGGMVEIIDDGEGEYDDEYEHEQHDEVDLQRAQAMLAQQQRGGHADVRSPSPPLPASLAAGPQRQARK